MGLSDQMSSAQERAREIKYNQIDKLPEDLNAMIRQLQEVRSAYYSVSGGTGLGNEQFFAKIDKVIRKLKGAAESLGSVKL